MAKRAIIINLILTGIMALLTIVTFGTSLDMERKMFTVCLLLLTLFALRNPMITIFGFEANHINKKQTVEECRQKVINEAMKRRADRQPVNPEQDNHEESPIAI